MLVVLKFRCCLLVVLRLTSRMIRMVIPRVWALLSVICSKGSLFFGSSFEVGCYNGGMVIGRIWVLLSAICPKVSIFFQVVLRLSSRILQMMIARVWALFSAICRKVWLFFCW